MTETETLTITAGDLEVGDVLDLAPGVTVRIEAVDRTKPRTVEFAVRYLACRFEPDRVGRRWHVAKRRSTRVTATRSLGPAA